VGGIKIDPPVTLALTLWPWPSVDQWFKRDKVQIITYHAAEDETLLGWTVLVLLTPNLLQELIKQDLRDTGDAFHGQW